MKSKTTESPEDIGSASTQHEGQASIDHGFGLKDGGVSLPEGPVDTQELARHLLQGPQVDLCDDCDTDENNCSMNPPGRTAGCAKYEQRDSTANWHIRPGSDQSYDY